QVPHPWPRHVAVTPTRCPRSHSISTLTSAHLPRLRVRRRKTRLPKPPAWLDSLPFLAMHVACLGVFFVHVGMADWVLAGVLYFARMFGITAGYHRYFAHRS